MYIHYKGNFLNINNNCKEVLYLHLRIAINEYVLAMLTHTHAHICLNLHTNTTNSISKSSPIKAIYLETSKHI